MKKKTINKIVLLLIVILVVCCVVYVFNTYKMGKNVSDRKEIAVIEDYNYKLYEDQSKNYKKLFKQLEDVLSEKNINEEEYVKVISQMFVMDFYTLKNKNENSNIGGEEFVYSEVITNFKEKAQDTLYLYLENAKKEALPIVEEVTVNKVSNTPYYYLKKVDKNAYQVNVSIEYEKDLGYQKESTLFFIHDGKKLSLVEIA